jgi:hypothetical protein
MPYPLQLFFIVAGAAAVLGLGTWWTLKFKRVYLDPWPTDPKLSSVFMRMTASDAKPFYACKFIKDNSLKGKMFNYWTEGGFIAWGQQADPNSGKTPLRLFMDGRAQAAYMRAAYDLWSDIMFGGPIVQSVRVRRREFTNEDYSKVGKWIGQQLKKRNVWVVLMPAGEWRKPFVRGLQTNRNWPLIFFNNKQKLFVDIRTPQAKKLFDGILTGKTRYPDDFSKNLIMAHLSLANKQSARQGFDFATEAFRLNPSQAPMQKILSAARHPELRGAVKKFCEDYLADFTKNKDAWAAQDGYHHRIVAALNAATYLRQIARRQKNTPLAQSYNAKVREYNRERVRLVRTKRW